MDSINLLIDFLIKSKPKEIRKKLNDCSDAGDIVREYKKDSVSENALIQLLQCSMKNKDIQWFLIDIFFFIEENSITDRVFEICLNYPGRFKKTLLLQLSHVWLKEEQLKKLNSVLETSEAFYKLFLLYFFSEKVSVEQLYQFLLNNNKHLYSLKNYRENLANKTVDKDKVNVVEKILNDVSINI